MSEKIFDVVKSIGATISAFAALVLACFAAKKEIDKAKEAKEAEKVTDAPKTE